MITACLPQPFSGFSSADREAREEAALGGAVGLERAVELEVLGGDVGQHGHVVGRTSHALLRQTVRGRLDHRPAVAGVEHGGEVVCSSGASGVLVRAALPRLWPPTMTSVVPSRPVGLPGALEQGAHEVGRGGLAVGAGDAHDAEVV